MCVAALNHSLAYCCDMWWGLLIIMKSGRCANYVLELQRYITLHEHCLVNRYYIGRISWTLAGSYYAPGGIITPRACARGKAIGLSVCCCCHCRRHKNRGISSSRCLCVLKAQPIGRYRWKTGLYALRISQKGLLVLQIVHFLFSMPVVYQPHPLF